MRREREEERERERERGREIRLSMNRHQDSMCEVFLGGTEVVWFWAV